MFPEERWDTVVVMITKRIVSTVYESNTVIIEFQRFGVGAAQIVIT